VVVADELAAAGGVEAGLASDFVSVFASALFPLSDELASTESAFLFAPLDDE